MVSITSLLNPSSPSSERTEMSPSISRNPSPFSPSPLASKKPKMFKAAAKFVKGKAKGQINYPPFEVQDETILAEQAKYEVKPIGQISTYPRRIPYNSDKKSFQQKTGRDGFEVYQYTFRMPGDDRSKDAHSIMWDYNIGLVRVTALFKSLEHAKTMPAKVMSANPGLRDISHSITGGSISAQGYWVPFEAAKAVATRLCYKIRYVLVPVFGPDFVHTCHGPEDPKYENLSIDRDILRRCIEEAATFQTQSRESSLVASPKSLSKYAELPIWPPKKSCRPKHRKAADIESGYGTDTDRSEVVSSYPGSPINSGWTPVNTPKVTRLENLRYLRSPKKITSIPWVQASPLNGPRTKPSISKRILPVDDASDVDSLPKSLVLTPMSSKRQKISSSLDAEATPEMEAAYTLIQLNLADRALAEERKTLQRRRASA